MKRIAVLSFIIGLLGVPIQAQAEFQIGRAAKQNAAPVDEFERQQQVFQALQYGLAAKRQLLEEAEQNAVREAAQNRDPVKALEIEQAIKDIRAMKRQQMLEEAEQNRMIENTLRREPEQNAAPPTQYYAAPPTRYSDPGVELQRRGNNTRSLIDFNRGQTQNTIDLMRSMNRPR